MNRQDTIPEFDWLIHYRCNYRCPYCFFDGMWEEVEKRNRYLPPEKWLEAWRRIFEMYKKVHLIITGGEPFVYPSFTELIQELSNYFSIGFDTNLSCSKEDLANFVERVAPVNISMGLSFHSIFTELSSFLDKALFLHKHGYNIYIQYVGYPPQIKQMEYFQDIFIQEGLHFVPLPFRGRYNGTHYPDAYTEEERQLIYNSLENLEAGHKERVVQMLNQVKSKGRLCRAGQVYARVDCDGTVYRCGHYTTSVISRPIGNIFDDKFKLLEEPLPCQQEVCPCEFRWLIE